MLKKVAILQSNYIPWKGYFDIINMVDVFVIYDDVQFTKRDWRNRNIIKTLNGLSWLTIPVQVKGRYYQKINEVITTNSKWCTKHWQSIKMNYAKAPYFDAFSSIIENIFYSSPKQNLSEINYHFIKSIMRILNIQTEIIFSSSLGIYGDKTERLVNICLNLGANVYLSGPSAMNYLQTQEFNKTNIEVEWMNYLQYPEYNQLFPPFKHEVTILDLIFNEGPNACNYMKSFEK